ncbi:MAG: glycine dehydrogenase subunit 2, partial [Pseudomonadota bacterium]
NNYMDKRLSEIPGLAISNPDVKARRMEMTRWSLGPIAEETGIGTVEFANRMADYGIDPWWMSHEPWIVAEPFTPEAGELWSKEDIDTWIEVVAKICEEARSDPDMVKSAPHNQAIAQVKGDAFEDPSLWAMTWRAWKRKHAGKDAERGAA